MPTALLDAIANVLRAEIQVPGALILTEAKNPAGARIEITKSSRVVAICLDDVPLKLCQIPGCTSAFSLQDRLFPLFRSQEKICAEVQTTFYSASQIRVTGPRTLLRCMC